MIDNTYPIEKIKKAIKGSLGQIGVVARRLGVERELIVEYIYKFPELAKYLAYEEEDVKDAIVMAFLAKIKEGNIPCIIHGLKTLCKDRGYSENVQMKPTQMQLFQTKTEYDLGRLTDDELTELERINRKLEGGTE